ncbi:endonuclease/exonuclease/phosphatase family protein [Parabacteroides sp. Marseille-P3160]|uniref:endonuclease/exonuclease/phosphatase family protein n=1 Tax=Parabacteroides sp. Marseille-P3160 TaxID=1917887 RepID=UPI0009BB4CA5|nr:endonuclease/exonuclease/phosphatase family protein [Parabacteroides sp. Marseille-P3160]
MKRFNLFFLITLSLYLSAEINFASAQTYGKNFRIMSYNIHHAEGMDKVIDYQRIADVINRQSPDVVALQEIDSATGRNNGADVLRELSERTLMHRTFGPAIEYDGGRYGVGILSKERPIRSWQVPLPGQGEKRTMLMVEFEKFIFCCTHLSVTGSDRMASLPILKKEAAAAGKTFIMAGDWNAVPESDFMAGLTTDFTILTNPKQPTVPVVNPKNCIDYVGVYTGNKKDIPFSVVAAKVIDEPVASDHLPLYVDLRFKAKAPKEAIFYSSPYLQNPVNAGITVMWQTNVPAYGWIEYGTDTLHLKKARTLVDGQVICNGLHNKIRLEGLEEGKTYYYRACSQEITLYQAYKKEFGETAVTPFYSFTLPSSRTTDFTALIFNDLHRKKPVLEALYRQVQDVTYDFVVFNGDCIDDANTEAEALDFLSTMCGKVKASNVPAFFLRGNHEIRGAYSIGLRALFDYVDDKTYAGFNWGDTRFVFLDCGEDKPDSTWVYYDLNDFTDLRKEQVKFLEKELKNPAYRQAARRILVNHIPLYGYNSKFQPCVELWGDLLSKAPFDLNLSGHTHRYAYHPENTAGNHFPVVIGGGNTLETATVMILQKKGKALTLRVLDTKGNEKLNLNL